MIELSECLALRVKDEDVSLYALLRIAKLKGQLQFIDDAIEATLIRQNATSRGIGVSDEELQKAADEFRVARDLQDVEATNTCFQPVGELSRPGGSFAVAYHVNLSCPTFRIPKRLPAPQVSLLAPGRMSLPW